MATPLPPSTIGTGALYTPQTSSASAIANAQPRSSPIAHFSSLPNDGIGNDSLLKSSKGPVKEEGGIPSSGRLLAVNSSYIAYAVKKGLVRVIDRKSAAKTLLRGHDELTRMVDAAFFGESSGKEGVGGLWEGLGSMKRQMAGAGAGGGDDASSNGPVPPAAASDVLATLGGASGSLGGSDGESGGGGGGAANILIWRIHSSASNSLGADKLLEVRYGKAGRLIWHPFNPNRFLLLSRNLGAEKDDEGGGGGRTVATLVETTRLVTTPHESDGHMVCDCKVWEQGGGVPGMIPLRVEGDDSSLAGANDISWSDKDARHVLTGHDDGKVRLWDLTAQSKIGETNELCIPCVAQLDVTLPNADNEGSSKRVTRALFLSQYEADGGGVTPPFITGTDMNSTITLWSGFPAAGSSVGAPSRLRVFGLRNSDAPPPSLSNVMSVELIPAPYRPPVAAEAGMGVIAPSSFLLLAERKSGIMHALHLDTEWKEGGDAEEGGDAVVVKGFDYVSTLNVVHPIYSYCVAPSSKEGDVPSASLHAERDVDLCCIQSKAVQMLTLSAEMCDAPNDGTVGLERGNLAPGVTLLDLPTEVSDDEEEEVEEEEFEEEYDMEEEGSAMAEYSTNDSGDEEDESGYEDVPVPVATDSEPNAFSNWLGAIANPLPPPTVAAPSAPPAPAANKPPPPGLGFTSILPPPPGMAPSAAPSAAPVVVAPIAEPAPPPPLVAAMTFLSPMQILSESTSDLVELAQKKPELPPKKPELPPAAKATSPATVPAPAPPPGMPASKKPVSKKSGKKNKSRDNTPKVRDNTPKKEVLGPMKILQRAEAPSKEEVRETSRSPILPPLPTTSAGAPSNVSTSADTAPSALSTKPSESSNINIDVIEATVQRVMKSQEAELLKLIRKVIATEVASQVGNVVSSSVKDSFMEANKVKQSDNKSKDKANKQAVEVAVQRGVSSGLAGGLESGLENGLDRALVSALGENGSLGKRLEMHARESAEKAAKEAVVGMQPVIVDTLNQTMREVMIPAYESATRQMFQQSSTTLEQGLAQMSLNQQQANQNNNNASLAPTLQAMSAQMMKMGEALQSLSAEVVQLRGAMSAMGNAAGTNGANGSQQHLQGVTPQPMGMRNEITAFLSSHRYEEAFTKAVSASDGEIVLFACKQADSTAVFNGEVGSVSQPILICLMQQLGAVLVSATDGGDMKVILSWLQEIAVTIDPNNMNIQRHVGSVVQQLLANINSKMSNCDPAFRRQLQMLMQVIRGLL